MVDFFLNMPVYYTKNVETIDGFYSGYIDGDYVVIGRGLFDYHGKIVQNTYSNGTGVADADTCGECYCVLYHTWTWIVLLYYSHECANTGCVFTGNICVWRI